jgi:5-methylthioribose kinase
MLDVNNFSILKEYLSERNIIDSNYPVLIQSLPGGVSNSVLKISCDRGQFVLKQALPKLKVAGEWVSDVARSNVEKQALEFLYRIIPGTTPGLLYEDESNYLFIMECAPESSVTWKSLLLKQNCNPSLAKKIGNILGRLHQNTHNLQEARELFGNKKYFHQLRIEPFFEFLKCKYPDLKKNIDQHIAICLERESSIVIGDYSPKNILVCDEQVVVIDFEVIHYGDTSFDLGFLTTHLLLKSLHAWKLRHSYYDILQATVDGYFSCIQFAKRADLELQCIQQLAWILLARVDGKSPIEYISEEKDKQLIRYASREILNNNMKTYKEVIEFFNLKMNQN